MPLHTCEHEYTCVCTVPSTHLFFIHIQGDFKRYKDFLFTSVNTTLLSEVNIVPIFYVEFMTCQKHIVKKITNVYSEKFLKNDVQKVSLIIFHVLLLKIILQKYVNLLVGKSFTKGISEVLCLNKFVL